ncbi:MAG: T9SS type A sorting domain-containing protein [Candidatus Hatepunaea meridiana]|nr:T9SS type A sorting domain-containing protein [Candidatus Hatepunaea meridiana]
MTIGNTEYAVLISDNSPYDLLETIIFGEEDIDISLYIEPGVIIEVGNPPAPNEDGFAWGDDWDDWANLDYQNYYLEFSSNNRIRCMGEEDNPVIFRSVNRNADPSEADRSWGGIKLHFSGNMFYYTEIYDAGGEVFIGTPDQWFNSETFLGQGREIKANDEAVLLYGRSAAVFRDCIIRNSWCNGIRWFSNEACINQLYLDNTVITGTEDVGEDDDYVHHDKWISDQYCYQAFQGYYRIGNGILIETDMTLNGRVLIENNSGFDLVGQGFRNRASNIVINESNGVSIEFDHSTCNYAGVFGIDAHQCDDISISIDNHSTVNNNGNNGIDMGGVTNSEISVSDFSHVNQNYNGIYLWSSRFNTISILDNCTVDNNRNDGIHIGSIISDNRDTDERNEIFVSQLSTVNDNDCDGVFSGGDKTGITIQGYSSVSHNGENGIFYLGDESIIDASFPDENVDDVGIRNNGSNGILIGRWTGIVSPDDPEGVFPRNCRIELYDHFKVESNGKNGIRVYGDQNELIMYNDVKVRWNDQRGIHFFGGLRHTIDISNSFITANGSGGDYYGGIVVNGSGTVNLTNVDIESNRSTGLQFGPHIDYVDPNRDEEEEPQQREFTGPLIVDLDNTDIWKTAHHSEDENDPELDSRGYGILVDTYFMRTINQVLFESHACILTIESDCHINNNDANGIRFFGHRSSIDAEGNPNETLSKLEVSNSSIYNNGCYMKPDGSINGDGINIPAPPRNVSPNFFITAIEHILVKNSVINNNQGDGISAGCLIYPVLDDEILNNPVIVVDNSIINGNSEHGLNYRMIPRVYANPENTFTYWGYLWVHNNSVFNSNGGDGIHIINDPEDDDSDFNVETTFRFCIDSSSFVNNSGCHIRTIGAIGWDDNDGEQAIIRKCWFEGSDSAIVVTDREFEDLNEEHPNITVYNNYFLNQEHICLSLESFESLNLFSIYNNTFKAGWGAIDAAVSFTRACDNEYDVIAHPDSVFNNIFSGGVYAIVDFGNAGEDNQYDYNCFFEQSGDYCDGDCEVDFDGNHNLLDPVDPKLYNPAEGPALRWNSLCINAGWNGNDDELVDRTLIDEEEDLWFITPNDMGCNGGPFAGVLDLNHYNIMDGEDIADLEFENHPEFEGEADGQALNVPHLPRDDYEIINSVMIDNGDALNILKNTAFYIHEDVSIHVLGSIIANGLDDDVRLIRFDKFTDEDSWNQIFIYNPDENCYLNGCDIYNAIECVDAWSSVIADPILYIENSRLCYADHYNLRVSGEAKVRCLSTEFLHSNWSGIYIKTNTWNTHIQQCTIAYNGYGTHNHGIEIRSNSYPTIILNTIKYNADNGIYLYDAGRLELNGWDFAEEVGIANDIYNNGQNIDQSGNYYGAEIRVRNESELFVIHNNIWDVDNSEPFGLRQGKLISNHPTNGLPCMATNNWWGDGWRDTWPLVETVAETLAIHFYWDVVTPISVDPKSENYNAVGDRNNPPNWNDDITDYELGVSAQEHGQFRQAISYFRRYIASHRGNNHKINSLQRILSCYRANDGDLSELSDEFMSISRQYNRNFQSLSWVARKLACYCALYSGHPEEAIEEFEEIIDEAPYPSDSLLILVNILDIREMMEEDHIDRAYDYSAKINELCKMLDEVDEGRIGKSSLLPVNYDIKPAYPNPFNSYTNITYSIPEPCLVKITIYGVNGRLIKTLLNDQIDAGNHKLTWGASNRPSGIYFCRMETMSYKHTVKLLLVR